LIILDFRPEVEYNESHIRKAIRVTPETYKQVIASAFVSLQNEKEVDDSKKDEQDQKKGDP